MQLKNKQLLTLAGAVVCLLQIACSGSRSATNSLKDKELEGLVKMMTGDFSSLAQSQRDSDYFDIRLAVRPIWKNDASNHWLYVEQAMASAQTKPYRQRIYKVERNPEGGFRSLVYTLPTPEKWVGGQKNTAIFDALKPADLSLREGCTVFLKLEKDGSFRGSTLGEGCESNLRGAKYATSTVTINSRMMKSWDQGFDASGKQVWGATKGGYEFVKIGSGM